jgi:hypothetical protein
MRHESELASIGSNVNNALHIFKKPAPLNAVQICKEAKRNEVAVEQSL